MRSANMQTHTGSPNDSQNQIVAAKTDLLALPNDPSALPSSTGTTTTQSDARSFGDSSSTIDMAALANGSKPNRLRRRSRTVALVSVPNAAAPKSNERGAVGTAALMDGGLFDDSLVLKEGILLIKVKRPGAGWSPLAHSSWEDHFVRILPGTIVILMKRGRRFGDMVGNGCK